MHFIKNIYKKNKNIIASISTGLLLVYYYIPILPFPIKDLIQKQVYTIALYISTIVLCLIFLQIVLYIYLKVSAEKENDPKIFEDYYQAAEEMKKLIDKQIQSKNRNISLKWIGTDMSYGWGFLKEKSEYIKSRQPDVSIDIEMAMLAKEWSEAANFELQFQQADLEEQYNIINRYAEKNNKKSNGKREFSLYTYKHMPYVTGLMIDDKFLFLGLCQWWNENKYQVGSNRYILYTKGKGEEHERQIEQYQGWFSYCKKHSTNS